MLDTIYPCTSVHCGNPRDGWKIAVITIGVVFVVFVAIGAVMKCIDHKNKRILERERQMLISSHDSRSNYAITISTPRTNTQSDNAMV